jgi:hypothetical protein
VCCLPEGGGNPTCHVVELEAPLAASMASASAKSNVCQPGLLHSGGPALWRRAKRQRLKKAPHRFQASPPPFQCSLVAPLYSVPRALRWCRSGPFMAGS